MTQPSPAIIPMNNLGNSSPMTSAAVKQNSRPLVASLRAGNLAAQKVASMPQGQPQSQTPATSGEITGSSHTNAIIQNQGPNNLGQQNVQIQGQPLPPQSIVYHVAPPCGCTANAFCQQHVPVSNANTIVKCVKFLACWDCGPVGIIIAAVAFAIGTVASYFAMKLAIWTATKDYIEHCQADEEAQRATIQCKKAASQALPPPPFFQYDPTNDTLIPRTLGETLLGSTESNAYNSSYVLAYALLGHALCWLVLSAICYFAWKIPVIRYNSTRLARNVVLSPKYNHKSESHEPTRASTSALTNSNGNNTASLRRRGHNRHDSNFKFPLLQENVMCDIKGDSKFAQRSLAIRLTKGPIVPSFKAGKSIKFGQILNDSEPSLRKRSRIHKLVNSNIRGLLGLYGLEISACTGNARRISLVDMLFISPLKEILVFSQWKTAPLRYNIETLVMAKNAERFLSFYERTKSEWRENIKRAILSCFNTLQLTGVDSEGSLLALTHIQDSLYIAEFSRETYSWGDILQDTEETFTVAVVTNTYLSSRSPLEGKRCANSAYSNEGSLALETRIAFATGTLDSSPKKFVH